MVKALKTVLIFLIGVSVLIFGGFVVCGNKSANLVMVGGVLMFVGASIVVLSGIFEHKRKRG